MGCHSKPRAATACPTGCHRPWRCHGTCHRCTHGTCRGTCHRRSRQYHGTCYGNPDGVQCHGMPWDCRGVHWNAMVLPWLGMDVTVWHCHALSKNGFPAAEGNMRAVHSSTVLVLYTWYCAVWKLNDELHASCNLPRCAMRWSCCGIPFNT